MCLALCLSTLVPSSARAEFVISEILVNNSGTTLSDENGFPADWIEIQNPEGTAASVDGYYLTDDPEDLTKWTLPDVTIGSNGYLLVFATGKDRAVAGSQLHTNFALGAGGEFLALVHPDGETLVSAFNPEFPEQRRDISYGIGSGGPVTGADFFLFGDEVTYLVPGSDIGSDWQTPTFDDTAWALAHTPIGWGYNSASGNDAFDIAPDGNLTTPMNGQNASVYVRAAFQITDPAEIISLTLKMKVDDGFVAFLNGTQVAEFNAPGTLAYDSRALAPEEVNDDEDYDYFPLNFAGTLVPGENILAIQGLNDTESSSDFVLIPELVGEVQDLSGGPQLGYFEEPTPGLPNRAAPSGFVDDTKFDIGRGFYTDPITVTITTATADASISYTTDGSEPTAGHGTVVAAQSAPVTISATTVLRAVAFRSGWAPTNIDTNTYLFLGDVIDQPVAPAGFPTTWGVFTGANGSQAGQPVPADYEMKPAIVNEDRAAMIAALESLPTMSIVAEPDDLFSDEGILPNPFATVNGSGVFTQSPFVKDRACSVEWFQPDGALEDQIDCGVRLTGGWSRHYSAVPKKSLRLSFKSEFGPSKWNFPLFGDGEISEFDKVQLRATFSDGWVDNAVPAQYLRDPFVRETFLAMGGAGARGTFVHLYINGLYWGIYNPGERPDADYGASHFGGSDADYDALKHQGLSGPGGAVTNAFEVIDGTATRWQEALAVTAGNMADPAVYAQFKDYVDVVSLADYFIVNTFVSNSDWPGKNWYAFGRRDGTDGGFKFSPWDSEYSLQNLNGNRINVSGTNTPARFYDRARANPEFRLLFADRVHKHAFNAGPLTASAMVARYSAMAAHIEPAISAEAARWGDNPNTRQGNRDFRKSHWLSARNSVLNSFMPNRPPIAMAQYRAANLYPSIAAPEFSQHGGVIDPAVVGFVDPPAGTIYYTTDGSDPRLEGGVANPAAGSFEGGSVTESYFDLEDSGWLYFVTPTGLGDSEVLDGHPSYNATHWKHPDFDDSTWPSGQAMLGYGGITGKSVNTTIGYGGNLLDRYRTTYFRKDFTIADAASVSKLLVDVIRDDGAIVYVNGHEVGRTNMAAGNRSYSDLASANASPEDEEINFSYTVPPGVLRDGSNTLAFEVHQQTSTSSDLGIDARLRGVVGAASIVLDASATIKARIHSPTGEWSALTEAFFTVAAEPASADSLVISKIHYRPAAPSQAEIDAGFVSRKEFEYLEFYNRGSERVSLAGVTIGGAIDFVFPADQLAELAPGERAVVVANIAAFQMRYGLTPRILGQFQSGKLSDDGEEIVVRDAAGAEIWRFTYNDAGAWPDSPDGGGPALVLIEPDNPPSNADLSSPENWRPGGSPGVDDRTYLSTWLSAQLNPDPFADPNGDGVNQLLDFTLGGGLGFLPSISIEMLDVGGLVDAYPVVAVRLRTGGAGVETVLRSSDDLATWSDAEVFLLSNHDNADGTHTLRYRTSMPMGQAGETVERFFQISVSVQP